jgi:hypothetical protein
MKRILAAAAFLAGAFACLPAAAQLAQVVTTCGSTSPFPTPAVNTLSLLTVNPAGQLCSTGGGGGGGGAVTAVAGAYADGSIVTLGTEADAAWSGTGSGTDTAILKAVYNAALTGTAGFGLSWPSSGIANGTKGSGATAIINPMWAPDSSAPIAIASGTGYVEAVAGVSGQSIRLFGYQVTVSANTALTWGWSASTSCTSVTALTGAMLFISGIGLQGVNGSDLLFTVPSGDTLCLSSGTSASVQGLVNYQQSP